MYSMNQRLNQHLYSFQQNVLELLEIELRFSWFTSFWNPNRFQNQQLFGTREKYLMHRLSQTQERTTKGHAHQTHPDVSANNIGGHKGGQFVAPLVGSQPTGDPDAHPTDPRQEDQNVNGHALVVTQDMLDALNGIGPAGNLAAGQGRKVGRGFGGGVVASLLDGLGGV